MLKDIKEGKLISHNETVLIFRGNWNNDKFLGQIISKISPKFIKIFNELEKAILSSMIIGANNLSWLDKRRFTNNKTGLATHMFEIELNEKKIDYKDIFIIPSNNKISFLKKN